MTPNLPGLVKHRHVWSLRHRVPKDIIETFGKKEVWRSLRTRDDRIAAQRYHTVKSEIEAEFNAHRTTLNQTPLNGALTAPARKRICQTYIANRIDEERLRRAKLLKSARANEITFWRGKIIPLPSDGRRYTYWDHLLEGGITLEKALGYLLACEGEHNISRIEAALKISDCEQFLKTADKLAERSKLSEDDRIRLALALMTAEIKVLKAVNDGVDLDDVLTPNPQNPPQSSDANPQQNAAQTATSYPRLSVAVKEWLEERKGDTPARRKVIDDTLYDFMQIVGDKPLDDYTKADGRKYKTTLATLAANWRKFKETRDLTIVEAAKRSKALGLHPQKTKTINTKLRVVGQCFTWVADNYDDNIRSPVAGLSIKNNTSARDERDSFTTNELDVLFRSPVYTGCQDERHWKQHGPMVLRDSPKFWIPLIALHTGMRLGEVAALDCDDLQERDRITFIDINKALKTKAAERQVPVHKQLVRLGLLDFRDRQTAKGKKRLFPSIEQDPNTGHYSDAFSKHFNRHLKSLDIKRSKLSFHSFRHSFEDFARNAGIEQTVIDALLGHVSPGMSSRYGKGYDLKRKNMELQKITFDGLRLDHLMPPKT